MSDLKQVFNTEGEHVGAVRELSGPFEMGRTGGSHQLPLCPGGLRQLESLMVNSRTFPEKLQFSGHETFPLRQLWLRKAYLAVAEPADDVSPENVFSEDSAIRRLGVGKNMVSAIRHWALACGVLAEGAGGVPEVAPIGDLLFGKQGVDPYLERPATCWLVHWMLAGRATRSTTWYWVFNRITSQTFDRNAVVLGLEELAALRRSRASAVTLKRDVEVCLRCYLSRREGREVDDAAEPLLADLGLITEGPTGTFQFRRGPQPTLPDGWGAASAPCRAGFKTGG